MGIIVSRIEKSTTVNTVYVEPVSEDRAHKCLGRIDLLVKIRRDVLVHPHVDERLNELAQSSLDLPDWWLPGKHDKELLIGVSRYGVAKMDVHILQDAELSFKGIVDKLAADVKTKGMSSAKPPKEKTESPFDALVKEEKDGKSKDEAKKAESTASKGGKDKDVSISKVEAPEQVKREVKKESDAKIETDVENS